MYGKMKKEWKFYKETNSCVWGKRIYEVSNFGEIKCNGKILQNNNSQRYYTTGGICIHRVVAQLFIQKLSQDRYNIFSVVCELTSIYFLIFLLFNVKILLLNIDK